uniref:Phosphoprotein n=1 Tax=Heterorhabditis bacteriophora TaxID=37862 RepID=A0A1I7WQD1_HETBA
MDRDPSTPPVLTAAVHVPHPHLRGRIDNLPKISPSTSNDDVIVDADKMEDHEVDFAGSRSAECSTEAGGELLTNNGKKCLNREEEERLSKMKDEIADQEREERLLTTHIKWMKQPIERDVYSAVGDDPGQILEDEDDDMMGMGRRRRIEIEDEEMHYIKEPSRLIIEGDGYSAGTENIVREEIDSDSLSMARLSPPPSDRDYIYSVNNNESVLDLYQDEEFKFDPVLLRYIKLRELMDQYCEVGSINEEAVGEFIGDIDHEKLPVNYSFESIPEHTLFEGLKLCSLMLVRHIGFAGAVKSPIQHILCLNGIQNVLDLKVFYDRRFRHRYQSIRNKWIQILNAKKSITTCEDEDGNKSSGSQPIKRSKLEI